MSARGTALIVGASGVIGQSALARFAGAGFDRVVGISRRPPVGLDVAGWEHLPLDLLDEVECANAARRLGDVTHVVYAALYEKPGLVSGWFEQDQMDTNLAMMRNLMSPLLAHAQGLQHVSVFQGTKAYGAHLHQIPVPAREIWPRDRHANFYWLQEDWLRERRAGAGWALTIWRPQVVFGGAIGVAMNIVPVLGIHAAICRELGLPFAYPGRRGGIGEAVDADLIADALLWAANAPAARDETFNITNGDVFAWANVWPALAEMVGLEAGAGEPFSLAEFLLAHEDTWRRIVARHALRPLDLRTLLGESHHYADLLFGVHAPPSAQRAPVLVSTIKLRQAGFGACIDTEVMFAKWLRRLGEQRIIPPLAS